MSNENALAGLPGDPGTHLRLWFFSAVLHLVERVMDAGGTEVWERFPFLGGYLDEVERLLAPAPDLPPEGSRAAWRTAAWRDAVAAWEAAQGPEIEGWPLRRLLASGLTPTHVLALMLAGLVEVDARFGTLYAALHPFPDERRLTVGLLEDLLYAAGAHLDGWTVASDLLAHGLLTTPQEDQPRSGWPLRVPGPIWDACGGERREHPVAAMRLIASGEFPRLADLQRTFPAEIAGRLGRAPAVMASGALGGLVLRGMRGSGRLAAAGAMARALNRAVLVLERPEPRDLPAHLGLLGPLATLLGALPVIDVEPGPGETLSLPALPGYAGPVAALLGQEGGLRGEAIAGCVTLQLPPPNRAARRVHWAQALGSAGNGTGGGQGADVIELLSARFHLTGGAIQQAGRLARAYAALDGRGHVLPGDVQEACRALNARALDALAVPLETGGSWDGLIVSEHTRRELQDLAMRCRQREAVLERLGPGFGRHTNRGVRALLSGPSGTGKTLAARILAAELGLDLYRVDLAAVVDKYVGETERNLSRLFARAEEQDIVLLLDEGDSLLTGRTDVHSANDRYANMETNYLLQRLEGYEGILLVTTNAAGRIDAAFQRRMDVHVEFVAPDAAQRYAIWRLHLPQEGEGVDETFLRLVAARCALNGGQIRNAALHATVLAVDAGRPLAQADVAEAIAREYRQLGGVSPLAAMLNGLRSQPADAAAAPGPGVVQPRQNGRVK